MDFANDDIKAMVILMISCHDMIDNFSERSAAPGLVGGQRG